MEIKEIIIGAIKTALWELKIEESKISKIGLEHPEDISHGDYSSNVAMVLSKTVSQNPRELAEKIVAEILERKSELIEKVEVAGPGFINFYLSNYFFKNKTKEIIKLGKKFGKNKNLRKQKTVVEYTDPNPFKEFHIGHLMSNAIGEAVSRVLEENGAKVIRACYQGDVGLHVAKTLWGANKMIKDDPLAKKYFLDGQVGDVKDLSIWGKAYALGATTYELDEIVKKEIIEINKKVYSREDKELNKLYKIGRKFSLKEFEKIYKILGTKFNKYFFESETTPIGIKIVQNNIACPARDSGLPGQGIFDRSEGAVIFKGENYGLHTRVFINSEGLPTYEAKDLGLTKLKYDRTKYDRSIIITANEQSDYFNVMLKALSLIYPELAEKTKHVSHGMLRLPEGKMSSRTGKVITAISLLDIIKQTITEKMKDRDMKESEKIETAEKIAVGALKYSILKQVTGKDIIFDFDKSISFEGDSGPYLQYSYARAKSILRKAKGEKVKANVDPSQIKIQFDGASINILERLLYRFPEVVERAGEEYSPHYIASYLIEISSAFNSFYGNNKIVDKTDLDSPYKVALTLAFSEVLKKGLNLLGISAPEKM
ncbi:MAG: arginine--tRNA ligase [bacterium]